MGMMEKTAFYLTIALIGLISFLIFFSKNGIVDYNTLKAKEAQVASRVIEAKATNRKLEKEIQSLRDDIQYIKHLAKHEHDMAEPGELIFKQQSSETQQP